jgi:hypothetical protein
VTIDRRRRILQTGCARPDAVELDLNDARLEAPGATAGAPELETLLAAARVLRDAGIEPRVLSEDRFGQLVAVDTAGLTLLLGSEAGLAEKAKLVAPVVAAARPGRRIRLVDLRAPATPTVEFR